MQHVYRSRLSKAVQTFVDEVEAAAGLAIEVVEDAALNSGGPAGQGKLKVDIEASRVRLFTPTNGYFPHGGVRHEALHVHRLHVDGVPRLALAEDGDWDPDFERALVGVDNALEHLIIVPIELRYHPERKAHWEAVMARAWHEDLPAAPSALDRRIGACLHGCFLRHVLPDSPAMDAAIAFMEAHDLRAQAESFCDEAVSRLTNKLSVIQMFFDRFHEVSRTRAAVEYLNNRSGSQIRPIPV
ncbi:MAG: hypothetical protein WCJ69_17870 [Betaproteobacteria bacterium]